MCLSPLTIRNPTRAISLNGGQPLQLQVPCGKCADCVRSKRKEWYFRTYYEVQNTFNKGGYVYFDTLTYDDEHLPKISRYVDTSLYPVKDFSCFSHDDFRAFLKRLRRRIKYHYNHNNAFKYFLTSEYGTDDRFTHRPHYHIMFFIIVDIDPLEFSRLVAETWIYGRTDGLPYQSVKYVSNHIYGRNVGYGTNRSFNAVSLACQYVSKYITKNSRFRDKLDKRIAVLRSFNIPDDELRSIIRNVDMFHRQSQGFGLSYLHSLDERIIDLLGEDLVCIIDKDKTIDIMPIPMYYKRHLYYTMKKRDDNTRYWELTDTGIEHTVNMKLKRIDTRVVNLLEKFHNADSKYYQTLIHYLDGRDISDYVIYELFYKGRMRYGDSIDYSKLFVEHGLTDFEYNLYDWISVIKEQYKCNSQIQAIIHDDDKVIIPNIKFTLCQLHKTMPYDKFIELCAFNENTCYMFRNFDRISSLIVDMLKDSNNKKQITFDYIEDLTEKYKIIYGTN